MIDAWMAPLYVGIRIWMEILEHCGWCWLLKVHFVWLLVSEVWGRQAEVGGYLLPPISGFEIQLEQNTSCLGYYP
jgi:hypothetical protein